jgi:CheY-like chemotaxis protein
MTLSALLVCMDEAAAVVLRRVLEELSIRVESCPDFARAAIRAAQERFDVIIVDGESSGNTFALLAETRMTRMNDATLAVAIVPSEESARDLFALGVNFVLYKPVAYDRALSSLRAARALMRKDKRKDARAPVHTHAMVDYANVEQEKATLIDMGKNGMAVLFGKKIPTTSKVYFQFKLPGQTATVRLSGQLVWQDWNGRAGVQFVDVPKAYRRQLEEYLAANLPSDTGREPSDVTVEMEEVPRSAAEVPAAIERHLSREPENGMRSDATAFSEEPGTIHVTQQIAVPEPAAHESADPNNRRSQTRYACRVGAEVYQTGSSVPNRCCLSDLSAGGCYLEVPLPFPKGSSVEIIVRTYEMKLNLRGLVNASHPGYGMGVAFILDTKEEQMNVKKLTDYVVATAMVSEQKN